MISKTLKMPLAHPSGKIVSLACIHQDIPKEKLQENTVFNSSKTFSLISISNNSLNKSLILNYQFNLK